MLHGPSLISKPLHIFSLSLY
jgi:hypothetical protein